MLAGLREGLKARRFVPQPVREKLISEPSGKLRRLGIPTAADRVVQAAPKLVLEPIFEADFLPSSYGFRPRRRAQNAIAEIHNLAPGNRRYEWVFEADITACFDEIDHSALMQRVRARIGDKRVLALVKAFLRAGILSEDAVHRNTSTGTPQGGILSPLLANIALSGLDEHPIAKWQALGRLAYAISDLAAARAHAAELIDTFLDCQYPKSPDWAAPWPPGAGSTWLRRHRPRQQARESRR